MPGRARGTRRIGLEKGRKKEGVGSCEEFDWISID